MNIQEALKQAQAMQGKIAKLQEQFEQEIVEGQAGGGMVKVTMACKGEVKKVEIDPSLLATSEKEVLEDLLVAALKNAKASGDQKMSDEMKQLTGSLGLPAGFNLPF